MHDGDMETLARSSLRWDSGYCVAMGVATAAAYRPVAEVIDASSLLITLIGAGAVAIDHEEPQALLEDLFLDLAR